MATTTNAAARLSGVEQIRRRCGRHDHRQPRQAAFDAAVDPFSKSILVNSEVGYPYRWDLATNTLSRKIRLTSGLGESHTPTAVGADGLV